MFDERQFQDALKFYSITGTRTHAFARINNRLIMGDGIAFAKQGLNPWFAINPPPVKKRAKIEDIEELHTLQFDIDFEHAADETEEPPVLRSCMRYYHKCLLEQGLFAVGQPLVCSGKGYHDAVAIPVLSIIGKQKQVNAAVGHVFEHYYKPVFLQACKTYHVKGKIECKDITRIFSMPGCMRPGKAGDPIYLQQGFLRHFVDYTPAHPPVRIEVPYVRALIEQALVLPDAEHVVKTATCTQYEQAYTQATCMKDILASPHLPELEKLRIEACDRSGLDVFTYIDSRITYHRAQTEKRHRIHGKVVWALLTRYQSAILPLLVAKYINEHIGDGRKFTGREEQATYHCVLKYHYPYPGKDETVLYAPVKRTYQIRCSDAAKHGFDAWMKQCVIVDAQAPLLQKDDVYQSYVETVTRQGYTAPVSKTHFTRLFNRAQQHITKKYLNGKTRTCVMGAWILNADVVCDVDLDGEGKDTQVSTLLHDARNVLNTVEVHQEMYTCSKHSRSQQASSTDISIQQQKKKKNTYI